MHKLTILLLGLFFTVSLSAQKTLLFEFSGKELIKPSYIYGTIHMICPSDLEFSETAKQKFKETEQLVLELDMDDPSLSSQMMSLAAYKNGESLKKDLSEEEYQNLSVFLKDSLGMSLEMFKAFKPVILISLVTSKFLACQAISYESELIKLAQTQKKEILGLETVAFQMSVFDKLSKEDLSKMFKSIVTEYPQMKAEFALMLENYKNKDLDKLLEGMNKSMLDYSRMSKDFLEDRNKDWLNKIPLISKEKSTFYGVGAGHLPGETGILNLLKKAGYTVKAI
jgi:uncharacterized protein